MIDMKYCLLSANTNPSTQGSGRKVFRFIPITLMMVLIADTPSHKDSNATLAGCTTRSEKSHE